MDRRVVSNPTETDDFRARVDGLTHTRDVVQMRRALPLNHPSVIKTRAFVPGKDDAAWIALNNRAFENHPDQSNMTLDRLREQIHTAWFNANGFLIYEINKQMAGFCWTKQHPQTHSDPAMGEIYVIGVDPTHHGKGLGRALVIAGLDWLSHAGETTGMLYVESTNVVARALYDSLGFTVHHVDRVYEAEATINQPANRPAW